LTLKLNRPAYSRANGLQAVAEKSSRIGVNSPVYVAGLERGVRAYRALIYIDHFIEMLQSFNAIARRGYETGAVDQARRIAV